MGYISINKERCKSCGLCVSVCKQELIEIGDSINAQGYFVAVFNDKDEECKGCKLCGEICPDVAIEVYK